MESGVSPPDLPIGDPPRENGGASGSEIDLKESLSLLARERRVLISDDALKLIIWTAGENGNYARTLLDGVLKEGELQYMREDGWLLLNRERTGKLIAHLEAESNGRTADDKAAPIVSKRADPVPDPMTSAVLERAAPESGPELVRVLLNGNEREILKLAAYNPEALKKDIKETILQLDKVFRARRAGAPVGEESKIAAILAGLNNDQLEELVDICFSVAESPYKKSVIGLKVAAIRAAALVTRTKF